MTEVVASTQPTIRKRNRANTVTQNDFKIPQQEEEEEVQKQIQDLQINKNDSTIKEEDEEEVINNDDDEEIEDDMVERHHHRSTISSIHSFASSANYDLLLARLGSKDSSVTSETNEIKTSFERVYNEAHEPHEKEEQEQEEIDWGNTIVWK
jgi:uncharacterized Zn finger protein